MSVTLEIPPDIVQSVRVPPQEVESRLRLELAIALYTQNLLSSGKACALAGLTRSEWEATLGKRQVHRHYSDADLVEDLGYGQCGQ
jgi:predicted HTH domain antitoxin